MGKTLQKTGNSYAAIIPREVLAAVGVDVDTPYELRVLGDGRIELQFAVPTESEKMFIDAALDSSFERHDKDYERLAK